MKKLLVVTVVALLLAFAIVGVASANGGPHGGYTPTTDACAGCHRAHTALGPNLLLGTDTYNFCMSCHGSTGLGANTNVEDGIFNSARDDAPSGANENWGAAQTPDGATLLGGGFINLDLPNVSTTNVQSVTSKHDAEGLLTDPNVWGYSASRGLSSSLGVGEFNCADCHDPHGNANYRIVKSTILLSNVTVITVDETIATKDYDTEQWAFTAGSSMNDFCGACHWTYHVTQLDSGTQQITPTEYANDFSSFAHRMGMNWDNNNKAGSTNPQTGIVSSSVTYSLPLAGAGDVVVCTTCHLPHGTSAAMSGFADSDKIGNVYNTDPDNSVLLRIDNRGVCETCHQKGAPYPK